MNQRPASRAQGERGRQREAHLSVPTSEPSALPPRPRRRQQMNGASLLVIGVVAFVFGVALHVYVVKSVLNSGGNDTGPTGTQQQQIVVSTETVQPSVAAATVTPTTAAEGDRTNCEAIRGTAYRSENERQFFLANCLTQTPPTPVPTTPAPAATNPAAVPTSTPKP